MGGNGAELLDGYGVNARAPRESFPPQHRGGGEVLLHREVARVAEVGFEMARIEGTRKGESAE
jgi:hypothetical protein